MPRLCHVHFLLTHNTEKTMKDQDAQADTEHSTPPITIITNCQKFALGEVVATRGALALLQKLNRSAASILAMHMHGDWGDVCKSDAALNEQALQDGSRLMSVYRLCDPLTLQQTPRSKRESLSTLWCITDAASDDDHPLTSRAVTTLLLPCEY